MTKPTIPARIGNDVYIRDNDDRTVQYKAKVYDTDFTSQMAKVGFEPERGKDFSEIHLPDEYRAEIPLSELSLEPHAGAQQKGYAEALLATGYQPATLAYLDRVGVTHTPGDAVPERALDKPVPVPQVSDDDGDDTRQLDFPQPDFEALDAAMKQEQAAAEKVLNSPAHLPNGGNTAIGMGALKAGAITTKQVMAAAETLVRGMGKPPPLFTKEDVIAKCKQLRAEVDKLQQMAEGL